MSGVARALTISVGEDLDDFGWVVSADFGRPSIRRLGTRSILVGPDPDHLLQEADFVTGRPMSIGAHSGWSHRRVALIDRRLDEQSPAHQPISRHAK